jgi:hypothetical protein
MQPHHSLKQHRRRTNIGNYDAQQTPFGYRLGEGGRGCLAIFGFIFLLPGLYLLASLFQITPTKTPEALSGEWFGLLLFAVAFSIFGSALGFYRSFTEIDFKKQEIRISKGIFVAKIAESLPLSDFNSIVITREVSPNTESDDEFVYPVRLNAKNGRHCILANYSRLEDSIKLAVEVGARSGLKSYDKTTAAELELTTHDTNQKLDTDMSSPVLDLRDTQFIWDGNIASLSQLWTGQLHGMPIYKIVYPKHLGRRLIPLAMGMGFFIYLFGWRIDKVSVEIFSGFFDASFTTSAEVFFSTIFGSLFVIFLIYAPAIGVLIGALSKPQYSVIGIISSGLYIGGTKKSEVLTLSYDKIKSLDIKTANKIEGQKQWKLEKRNNLIALRFGDKYYEIAKGLDLNQLQKIAGEISQRMLRKAP